jgi:hypothetical protein
MSDGVMKAPPIEPLLFVVGYHVLLYKLDGLLVCG